MAIDFYIGVCMYVYQYVILYILYIGLLGDVWGVGGGVCVYALHISQTSSLFSITFFLFSTSMVNCWALCAPRRRK